MTSRTLIDATAIPADRGGVGRYVDGLIGGLHGAGAGADLAVVCKPADAERFGVIAPSAHVEIAPAALGRRPVRLAWEQVGLPRLARRLGVDVLHSPHYTLPARTGPPVVVTVHDLTWFSDPGLHRPGKRAFFRTATRLAARRATRLIVPSAATRDELLARVNADSRRIDVIHHGVEHDVFRPPTAEEAARVAKTLGLERASGYVAFLGTLEPRKNVPALIRGWAMAMAMTGRGDPPALVLAGGPGWDCEIEAAVASIPPGLQLVRPGYLPFEDLPGFLGGALVVAYPSLGEGFGLPVLEAMACGAAVLTTERLSLPEVGGDAVAYTGTTADAIATSLGALLDDPPRRAALGRRAHERAAGFTWEKCAVEHLAAYERAAKGAEAA